MARRKPKRQKKDTAVTETAKSEVRSQRLATRSVIVASSVILFLIAVVTFYRDFHESPRIEIRIRKLSFYDQWKEGDPFFGTEIEIINRGRTAVLIEDARLVFEEKSSGKPLMSSFHFVHNGGGGLRRRLDASESLIETVVYQMPFSFDEPEQRAYAKWIDGDEHGRSDRLAERYGAIRVLLRISGTDVFSLPFGTSDLGRRIVIAHTFYLEESGERVPGIVFFGAVNTDRSALVTMENKDLILPEHYGQPIPTPP